MWTWLGATMFNVHCKYGCPKLKIHLGSLFYVSYYLWAFLGTPPGTESEFCISFGCDLLSQESSVGVIRSRKREAF